jgi:hypothetical protein
MDVVKRGMFEEMVEIADIDSKIKSRISQEPALKSSVEKWIGKHLGVPQLSSVKICTVFSIDYNAIDLDSEDEFEYKELTEKIKHNHRCCPNHINCPLFLANATVENDRCLLELMDVEYLTNGLMTELDINELEFNDKIIVGQLISLNLIYSRAMRALASESLIQEVKIISKGDLKLDTKVNENLGVAERTLGLMERIRKSLILNREDKARYKQIKKANDEMSARKKVDQAVKSFQEELVIGEDIDFQDIEA